MVKMAQRLAASGRIRLTLHARAEMDADGVETDDLIRAIQMRGAEIIENYPNDPRGPSHLVLAWLTPERPVHICCAIHEGTLIIITAYRPDARRWSVDWRKRR